MCFAFLGAFLSTGNYNIMKNKGPDQTAHGKNNHDLYSLWDPVLYSLFFFWFKLYSAVIILNHAESLFVNRVELDQLATVRRQIHSNICHENAMYREQEKPDLIWYIFA